MDGKEFATPAGLYKPAHGGRPGTVKGGYVWKNNVAEHLWNNLCNVRKPDSAAQMVDYGLDIESNDPEALLRALTDVVRGDKVTKSEFDAACGNGEQITEIAKRCGYTGTVITVWDLLQMDNEDSGAEEDE